MQIEIIPCLRDNYAFLLDVGQNNNNRISVLIDAPEFESIDNFLRKNNRTVNYILNTHHHWDHVGGNLALKERYSCKIIGSENDQARIPGIDHHLKNNEEMHLGDQTIQTHFVPGHTNNHVIYFFKDAKVLFTGDTLFSMGCGRLFEGTYQEMFDSLQLIKKFPEETLIYCGHEYTIKNGEFALSAQPDNPAIQRRLKEARELVQRGQPTIPATLELERKTNPFLMASTVDEFSQLRQRRDSF